MNRYTFIVIFFIGILATPILAYQWTPLDNCSDVTAAGNLGWNTGSGFPFQSNTIVTAGESGSMGLPGQAGTPYQYQRNWAPSIDVSPITQWMQFWIKPDNSADVFACYWIATNPSNTTQTQFNDFRQHLKFSEWRPVVYYLNYFTGRNGSPGPQIDYTHVLALAYQYFGSGPSNYTTYIDDIEVRYWPTIAQEVDYMDQGFFGFGSSTSTTVFSVSYDTISNKWTSGFRSLLLQKFATTAADSVYAQEQFNDTSFGKPTTRNYDPNFWKNIEMDVWGDNSNAVLQVRFTNINPSIYFYSNFTVNFSGLKHLAFPISGFSAGTAGGSAANWQNVEYFSIRDESGNIPFSINVDSVIATPIPLPVSVEKRDWMIYQ